MPRKKRNTGYQKTLYEVFGEELRIQSPRMIKDDLYVLPMVYDYEKLYSVISLVDKNFLEDFEYAPYVRGQMTWKKPTHLIDIEQLKRSIKSFNKCLHIQAQFRNKEKHIIKLYRATTNQHLLNDETFLVKRKIITHKECNDTNHFGGRVKPKKSCKILKKRYVPNIDLKDWFILPDIKQKIVTEGVTCDSIYVDI